MPGSGCVLSLVNVSSGERVHARRRGAFGRGAFLGAGLLRLLMGAPFALTGEFAAHGGDPQADPDLADVRGDHGSCSSRAARSAASHRAIVSRISLATMRSARTHAARCGEIRFTRGMDLTIPAGAIFARRARASSRERSRPGSIGSMVFLDGGIGAGRGPCARSYVCSAACIAWVIAWG